MDALENPSLDFDRFTFAPLPIQPKLEGEEYDALFRSIRQKGLLYPVVADRGYRICDGRVRLVICRSLGIPLRVRFVDDGIAAFLAGMVRRTYTPSEKAVILEWRINHDPEMVQWLQRQRGRSNDLLASRFREMFPDENDISARTIAYYLTVGRATPAEREQAISRQGDRFISRLAKDIDEQHRSTHPDPQRETDNADTQRFTQFSRHINRLRTLLAMGPLSEDMTRLGRRFHGELGMVVGVEHRHEQVLAHRQEILPRAYQIEFVRQALAHISHGCTSLMLESPTGSGKTVVLLMLVKELVSQNSQIRVLWLAMNWNLLEQAQATNAAYGFVNPSNLIFATPFQGDISEADIMVVDEAHHYAARSLILATERCHPRLTIGASATPFRSDDFGLSFTTIVRGPSIDTLIAGGFLSPYNHFIHDSHDPQSILSLYCSDVERWGQTIIYMSTCTEAHDLASELRRKGIVAESVTGEQPRESTLMRFLNCCVRVICAVNAISEGLDIPSINTVFCRDASRGPVMQMTGRALRPSANKVANIIQSEHTSCLFSTVAHPRKQYRHELGSWHECIDFTVNRTTPTDTVPSRISA